MITITGKPVCSGVAFGPVFVFSREESTIKRHHIESSDDEIARFESARQQTISELAMLYDKALAEVGEANAMIFQIHQMMLDDLDYIESYRPAYKCRNRSCTNLRQFCANVPCNGRSVYA